MNNDKFDLLGPALAEVGDEAVRLVGGEPSGIFLYAEAGENWAGPSLYKDEGDWVRYVDMGRSPTLANLIMNAWDIEPADKRWTAMLYTIEAGKFQASFTFGNLNKPSEDGLDNRDRVLRARYGDKPIVYPPASPHAMLLKPPA